MKRQIETIRTTIAVAIAAALLALVVWTAAADCPIPPPPDGCGVDSVVPVRVWLPVVMR